MSYQIVQPPFTLNLREMPKSDLKRYFRWFIDMLPERVNELSKAVQQTRGFETWRPDRTPALLDMLGEWYAEQVETRSRTQEELQQLQQLSPIDAPTEELSNRTFSLAMDVGMYFSQVLMENHPSLRWEQPLGSKRFVDYGQPLVAGFGPVSVNPVRIAVSSAYAGASGNKRFKRLREIYDDLAGQVQP